MPRHFKIHDVAQRSIEWQRLRAGLLTGSCAGHAVAQPNARSSNSPELGDGIKETDKRRSLRYKLAAERICGVSFDQPFSTRWTEDGILWEPLAIAEFERITDNCVFSAGLLTHATLAAGFSPDGYVDDFAEIVECKCFDWKRHLESLSGDLDTEIQAQVFHGMWLTCAKRGHVVFHNPKFPEGLRTRIVTLDRKDTETKAQLDVFIGRAELFLEDVDKTVAYLRSLGTETEDVA